MANILKAHWFYSAISDRRYKIECQNIRHHLTFPIGTIQVTNVPEFQFDISTSYFNNFYLPNIKYTIEWKRFILG